MNEAIRKRAAGVRCESEPEDEDEANENIHHHCRRQRYGKSSLTGVLKNQLTDLGLIIDVDKLAEANNGDNIRAGRIAVQRIRSGISRGCVLPRKQPFPAP